MGHKVTVTTSHEFTEEEIGDLICTALEGGINYWCGRAVKVRNDDKTYKGVSAENQINIRFASDLIGYGGSLILFDAEYADTKEKWVLTLPKVLKGIKKHCIEQNKTLSDLMDDYDATDADCIVQYALFGKIIYG